MDWETVINILLDGNIDEIKNLKCSDCGMKIEFEFDNVYKSFIIKCLPCGIYIQRKGVYDTPNCVKFFCRKYVIN